MSGNTAPKLQIRYRFNVNDYIAECRKFNDGPENWVTLAEMLIYASTTPGFLPDKGFATYNNFCDKIRIGSQRRITLPLAYQSVKKHLRTPFRSNGFPRISPEAALALDRVITGLQAKGNNKVVNDILAHARSLKGITKGEVEHYAYSYGLITHHPRFANRTKTWLIDKIFDLESAVKSLTSKQNSTLKKAKVLQKELSLAVKGGYVVPKSRQKILQSTYVLT